MQEKQTQNGRSRTPAPTTPTVKTNATPTDRAARLRFLTTAGIIAGLYAALTLVLAPFSFGIVQCRLSEALTILAVYHPACSVGLTLGCAISNLIGLTMGANSAGALDILFGTLATGLAAWVSYALRGVRWGGLPVLSTIPPVVFNALIIGTELTFVVGPLNLPTWLMWMGSVGLGQMVACVGGGLLLAYSFKKSGLEPRLTANLFTNR